MSNFPHVVNDIGNCINQILHAFKSLGILESYTFKMKVSKSEINKNVTMDLNNFRHLLKAFLKTCKSVEISKPLERPAEIRNIITKLVKNKSKHIKLSEMYQNLEDTNENISFDESSIIDDIQLHDKDEISVETLKELCDVCQICKKLMPGFGRSKKCSTCEEQSLKTSLKKQLNCEYCNKMFRKKTELRLHITEIHLLFKPQFCNSQIDFVQHKEEHLITTNTLCSDETRDTSQSVGPEVRESSSPIKSKQSAFPCEQCDKTFSYQRSLNSHVKLKHVVKPSIHTCKICGKCFGELKKLRRHVLIHEDSKYKCELCESKFSRRDHLQRHISSVHEEGKKFTCLYCSKLFSSKNNRETHQQTVHVDEGCGIQCDICGKKVKNRRTFKSHLTIHSTKRFSCTLCTMAFTRRQEYKNHVKKKHSKYSPFQNLVDSTLKDEY